MAGLAPRLAQTATGTAVTWPRGEWLGGPSAITGMNFVRVHPPGYEDWSTAGVEIGSAPVFAPWRAVDEPPGPAAVHVQGWRAYLRRDLRSYSRPEGPYRRGRDEESDVDTKPRVRCVNGLRRADASIMPLSVSANTEATFYAIAARVAAFHTTLG
ncbi:GMC oxidoreductase [Streptomyces sp. NPDC001083]|uniref:GMC oxidoreductase n=1 Tax=Streptomyces sp. NPDC001083 TaxID=3364545 RepID=UPI00367DD16D